MANLQEEFRKAIVRAQPKVTSTLSDGKRGTSFLRIERNGKQAIVPLIDNRVGLNRIGSFG